MIVLYYCLYYMIYLVYLYMIFFNILMSSYKYGKVKYDCFFLLLSNNIIIFFDCYNCYIM